MQCAFLVRKCKRGEVTEFIQVHILSLKYILPFIKVFQLSKFSKLQWIRLYQVQIHRAHYQSTEKAELCQKKQNRILPVTEHELFSTFILLFFSGYFKHRSPTHKENVPYLPQDFLITSLEAL